MRKWKYKWSPRITDNLTVSYWIGDEINSAEITARCKQMLVDFVWLYIDTDIFTNS